ncbi:MAG: hypothetical protein EBY20_11370, partial [Alphaproteobacteria bacterium]|nr:hypothetical protein [Alphaproteobacteria bacterium]
MASKSKKQSLKKENSLPLVLVSLTFGVLALMQNPNGLMSDIGNFYIFHFQDGQNQWPFSEKIFSGDMRVQHPVEYPALTGLIMWLISFLVTPTSTVYVDYYRITAAFQIALLAVSAYLIYKLVGKKYAYYYILAPAVLYSLNRNWDIWAIATMLLSIYLFEKQRFQLSAILLAVSIATKFFPIVLMLPIMIIFLRNKQISIFIKYSLTTLVSWLIINLPFVLINFDGWAYFYRFSAERGLGSASFYEITSILIPAIKFSSVHFYILNSITAVIITYFFVKLKSKPNLAATSFFVMFGFILFNKQYSMQYVIWLSALAVIAMAYIKQGHRDLLIYVYVFWQASELAFQYSFFQKILTDAYANSATPMTITVSNTTYAYIGVIRYFLAV